MTDNSNQEVTDSNQDVDELEHLIRLTHVQAEIDPNQDADKLEYLTRLTHHVLSTYDEDVQAEMDELIPVEYHTYLNRVRLMTEDEITEVCVEIHQRYDGKSVISTV